MPIEDQVRFLCGLFSSRWNGPKIYVIWGCTKIFNMQSLQKSKKLRLQRGHRGQAKWFFWQNKYQVVQKVSSIKHFCSLSPSSSTWSVRILLILSCFPLTSMPILSTLLISTTQWLIPASQSLLTAFFEHSVHVKLFIIWRNSTNSRLLAIICQ